MPQWNDLMPIGNAVDDWIYTRYALHNINEASSINLIKFWLRKFCQTVLSVNIYPPGFPPTVRSNRSIDQVIYLY